MLGHLDSVLALSNPLASPGRHVPPCPLTAALHHPAPGHPLPGHLLRAAALLLPALVLLLDERAGAGEAAGVQLCAGTGGAVQLLQPAPQDHPRGEAGGEQQTRSARALPWCKAPRQTISHNFWLGNLMDFTHVLKRPWISTGG